LPAVLAQDSFETFLEAKLKIVVLRMEFLESTVFLLLCAEVRPSNPSAQRWSAESVEPRDLHFKPKLIDDSRSPSETGVVDAKLIILSVRAHRFDPVVPNGVDVGVDVGVDNDVAPGLAKI
jgi:hypothetical protein